MSNEQLCTDTKQIHSLLHLKNIRNVIKLTNIDHTKSNLTIYY